jgi:hypothetical protein
MARPNNYRQNKDKYRQYGENFNIVHYKPTAVQAELFRRAQRVGITLPQLIDTVILSSPKALLSMIKRRAGAPRTKRCGITEDHVSYPAIGSVHTLCTWLNANNINVSHVISDLLDAHMDSLSAMLDKRQRAYDAVAALVDMLGGI